MADDETEMLLNMLKQDREDAVRKEEAETRRSESSSAPVRLLTLPHSTYCEAARWALQAAGVAFVEETFVFCSEVLREPRPRFNKIPTFFRKIHMFFSKNLRIFCKTDLDVSMRLWPRQQPQSPSAACPS